MHLSKLIQISILVEALLVRGWIHVKTFNQRACPADLIWTLPFQEVSISKKYFTYQPKDCALDKKQILLLHCQLATPLIFNLEDLLRFLKFLVLRAARRKMGPVCHPLKL
jgi:hypothetical protein